MQNSRNISRYFGAQTSSADNNEDVEQQANNQEDTDTDVDGEGIVAEEAAAEHE